MSQQETILMGFSGKRRQGKDTACQEIIHANHHLYDIRRYAFADALKQEANRYLRECFGDGSHFLKSVGADLTAPLEYQERTLYQWWGTMRRSSDPWVWIGKLAKRIKEDEPQIALISDVRLLAELGWVRGHGGKVVRIVRLNTDGSTYEEPDGLGGHITETELDGIDLDFSIEADSVDELKECSREMFDFFMEKGTFPVFRSKKFNRYI